MLREAPIMSKNEDAFERSGYADHLADLLMLNKGEPSLVIALEGKWGVGKTSTINLIKSAILEKAEDAIIVDFNPWLLGSLDSVIEGFLLQLASSINESQKSDIASQTAARILNLAKFLTPIKLIPGIEPWGTIVETVLTTVSTSTQAAVDMSKLDLANRKQSVQTSIENLDKSIVVFIDDIDRLPPNEVQVVIQVVKAIADFSRVSYLLAYDPEPVERSLSYNGIYDGARYLEKIVQAPYPIPRVGYWHLKGFFKAHIDRMLKGQGFFISESEHQLVNQALDSTAIVRALSTPRDVIRCTNRITITAKNVCSEVNFADVLAFEVLDLKYPKVTSLIRTTPELFLQTTNLEGDTILQDYLDDKIEPNSEKEPKFISNLLANFSFVDVKNIRSILGFIFPPLIKKWQQLSLDEATANNRICTREALLKLLQAGTNAFTFSSAEIKHFLSDESDRKQILEDYLTSGTIESWLPYLNQFISSSTYIVNPSSLCLTLVEISSVAFCEFKLNLTECISTTITSLLYRDPKKQALLEEICRNERSLSVSEDVILQLLLKYNMWHSGTYYGPERASKAVAESFLTPEKLVEAKDLWVQTVNKVSLQRNILLTEPEPISVLFRWGQLNDNNYLVVQDYLSRIMTDEATILSFIKNLPNTKGLSGIEKLVKDVGELVACLESLANPPSGVDRIINHLKSIAEGKTPTDDDHP